MIAGVVAIAIVSVAAIGGVLSLAWVLVKRIDESADLRERLAVSRANVSASDADLDRMEAAYRGEVEKTASLVTAMARQRESSDPPADPFVLFDRVLGDWRTRTSAAADSIRAERKLRDPTDAQAVRGNADDGPGKASGVPAAIDESADLDVPDTSPQSPRALAAKGDRP